MITKLKNIYLDFYLFHLELSANINFINYCLIFSCIIFFIGILALIVSKNPIMWLFGLELLFIACVINFTGFSIFHSNPHVQAYSLFTLLLIAVESVLGLSLIFLIYHKKKTVEITEFKKSKL